MHGTLLLTHDLKINALEGRAEQFGEPEILPVRWNVPHVERRLIEAKRTLMADRSHIGPKEYGSAWPGYEDEWAKEVAAAQAVVGWIADQGEKDRAKVAVQSIGGGWIDLLRMARHDSEEAAEAFPQPTLAEMTRMEKALGWPGRYLGHGHRRMGQLLVAVQEVTQAKASGKDAEWLDRNYAGVWQGRCWAGCERIVWGLERDRVAVF